MKLIGAIAILLVVSSCASSRPPDDKRCVEVNNATVVLQSANRFVREKKRNPSSLSELVPTYLAELPRVPELEYNPADAQLSFSHYAYAGSEEFICGCEAKLKQRKFKCRCIG
jgi:hypothetical protein